MIRKLFYFLSDTNKRLKDSIAKRGIYHSLIFLITEIYYDRRLKLFTPNLNLNLNETIDKSSLKDSHRNTPGSYYLFFKSISKLKLDFSRSHFIDIGCGTGKIVCAAMSLGFKRVTGIDLDHEGLELAQANCTKTKKSFPAVEWEIEYAEAADFDIPATVNVIYFFNPFGRETMLKVIANIKKSIDKSPRIISVIYQNPLFEKDFLAAGFKLSYNIKSGKLNDAAILILE